MGKKIQHKGKIELSKADLKAIEYCLFLTFRTNDFPNDKDINPTRVAALESKISMMRLTSASASFELKEKNGKK